MCAYVFAGSMTTMWAREKSAGLFPSRARRAGKNAASCGTLISPIVMMYLLLLMYGGSDRARTGSPRVGVILDFPEALTDAASFCA